MSCADFEKFVSAFVDGELDVATARDFERHRAECASCAAIESGERAVKRAVRDRMRAVVAPADLRERIRASLDGVDAAARRRVDPKVWLAPLAAAASVAFIVFGSPEHEGDVLSAGLFENVTGVHEKNLPVEVRSENPAEVAGWYEGKVGFKVHPPRLQRRARLVGARIGHVGDQDAAILYYDLGGGHRMTVVQVLDRPVRGGRVVRVENREVLVARSRGYSNAYIRRGDLGYAFVSDLGPSETARLAAQVGW